MLAASEGLTMPAPSANLRKLRWKSHPRCSRVCWKACGSSQVRSGSIISGGTPLHATGTRRLKTPIVSHSADASSPEWTASTIACESSSPMRRPTPMGPPVQPVLTSHATVPCAVIRSASMPAYLYGCHTRNPLPKHAEKLACGSHSPLSLRPTLRLYPLTKWYIACSVVSRLTGGRTPNPSQTSMMMFLGCVPTQGTSALRMYRMG
mmetsp:Transcript_19633/g.46862  ORF Transcript_19633/g.46862 Transcript_19633/m.46862 type:complete len:207 (+) Transcript_19633:184-804(+)